MMARKLSTRQRYVCASTEYMNAHGLPHTLSELDQHNCLVSASDVWRFQVAKKVKNIRVSGNIRYNSSYAALDAAFPAAEPSELVELFSFELSEPSVVFSSSLKPN